LQYFFLCFTFWTFWISLAFLILTLLIPIGFPILPITHFDLPLTPIHPVAALTPVSFMPGFLILKFGFMRAGLSVFRTIVIRYSPMPVHPSPPVLAVRWRTGSESFPIAKLSGVHCRRWFPILGTC
jgi:hypothetical protein